MLNIRDPKLSSSYRDERTRTGTLRTQPVFTSFIDTSLGREEDEWTLPSTHPYSGPCGFFYLNLFFLTYIFTDLQLVNRTKHAAY